MKVRVQDCGSVAPPTEFAAEASHLICDEEGFLLDARQPIEIREYPDHPQFLFPTVQNYAAEGENSYSRL